MAVSILIARPGADDGVRPSADAEIDTGSDVNWIPLEIADEAGLVPGEWDVVRLAGGTPILGRVSPMVVDAESCTVETTAFVPIGELPRKLDLDRPVREQIVGAPPRLLLLGRPFLQDGGARLDFPDDELSCPPRGRRSRQAPPKVTRAGVRRPRRAAADY